jgi:cytochrome c
VFSPCSGCHGVRKANHGIGPDLMGVVGARIARHADYPYSDALRDMGGRWTRRRLDEFLRNPAGFAPGTTMQSTGIEDAAQRHSIIEYLQDLDDRE